MDIKVPTPKQVTEYHEALGRFIGAFAATEEAMQRALWHYAKVSDSVAKAVFSGTRIEGAISFVNRIAEAERWPESEIAKFKAIFDQVSLINSLRNDIVHYGTKFPDDERAFVTNAFRALSERRLRTTPVSAKLLDAATDDLFTINVQLLTLAWRAQMDDEFYEKWVRQAERRPWQYRPPRLEPRSNKSRKTPPKP